ncbi:HlyD family secretion protein [Stutzerimonas stutzeri]|nr:HlyD family secretion protein [Stutzerimonas stutzeri]
MTLVALVGVLAILYAWQLWPFKGQVLVRIDDRQYQQRVAQRRAERDAARFELENLDQQLAADRATLAARRADLFAAEAEEARARADERRVDELAERGSVSIRERDQTRASARAASANVRKARAAIEIAEQTLKASGISRGGLQARVEIAQATLHQAEIDLANTEIVAPGDGRVSEVGVRLGQYVTAGTQLLFLVPPKLWVIANYKETQTANMRPGQPVSFEVDALNGARLTGRIERIAPATGSEFSLLRPDNATGNFTKVVQRLPVRIAIDPDQPLLERLRPGLSVVTHVDTAAP